MVSLLQNLTATFLCYKCTCWWENNGQRWVKRTLQRTYCRCQRYTRKITFWLDLTHISTSLWLRCRIFCPCLWLDRRSPEKSFDCPINQIPTHQLNFSQYVKFLIQKSLEECVPTMKSSDNWNNVLYCTNSPFKLLQHYFMWEKKSGKAYKYEVTNPI